jgi:hypothetical protein
MHETQLNIAATRFAAFVSNLPLSPDELITTSSSFLKKSADKIYPSSELHQTE